MYENPGWGGGNGPPLPTPMPVCVRGATTEACATLFWATLNLFYYRKQCSLLITRPKTRC